MSKSFSAAEVAKHKASDDFWIIVDGDVYDLTTFQHEHPGGVKVLSRFGGKDASKPFWKFHNKSVLGKYGEKLKLGSVEPAAKL
ncbi:cytochrome b5-like heme/steroid binding domain-containing protein [Plectosphaerella plurivora]|uniref:Cytochrome b5-like heme/steroid binding domain-containing protein n=1 Tax=Plectosphaerella plurivora TaxID=936078 RepID=A0A9P8VKF4_9PEZI|nr:cytochrome b5-like heme/steroid binding domain-containing protein [Plectosphaerella plurivora]